MPRKNVIESFTFDELDDDAKETARDWYKQACDYDFDADDFKESILEESAAYYHRVKTEICHFSLGYCQGDGVAFYGWLDIDFFMAKPSEEGAPPDGGSLVKERNAIKKMIHRLRHVANAFSVMIGGHNSRYPHANSMDVEVRCDAPAKYDTLIAKLQAALQEYMSDVAHDAERIGYAELEYRSSDAVVDENIIDNAYEFTVDGARFVPPSKRKVKKR